MIQKLEKKQKQQAAAIVIIVALGIAGLITLWIFTYKPPEPPPSLPTTHLVLTMEFDDDPDGYNPGNMVNTLFFEENNTFVLSDKYGKFKGDYEYTGEKLTIDFYSYSSWYVTFINETHFTGRESGYDNGGTYEWI